VEVPHAQVVIPLFLDLCPGRLLATYVCSKPFLTPVPNAPFNAVVNIERTEIRKDGLVIKYNSMREVARDSRGRIHNELRSFIPVSSTDTPKLLNIHLYDPQTRISTEINVLKRTFWTRTMNHPPSTEPPSIRFAAPDGDAPPQRIYETRRSRDSRDRGCACTRDAANPDPVGREWRERGSYYRRTLVLAGSPHLRNDQT
jgi:hypothetical protein